MARVAAGFAAALALLSSGPASGASSPPSAPDLTAPALAVLGAHPVGRREVQLEPEGRTAARTLDALVWYPARTTGRPLPYEVELPAGPGRPEPTRARFPAAATADAAPARGPFPLVILSHGYGNAPEWLSWLGENLASKGYVVVAPRHRDPSYSGPSSLAEPLRFRTQDQALAAAAIQATLEREGGAWASLVEGSRWALVGYSMGGTGALRTAGARVNPSSPALALAPDLRRDMEGAPDLSAAPPGLAAVVLIAPWGGAPDVQLYRAEGLRQVQAPVLILAGEYDHVSGYEAGVRRYYEGLACADRWLFTFERAGHTLGLNPVPAEASDWLAGLEAFEDPVWRKARLHGVSQHLVTALLDLKLKGSADRAVFLDRPAATRPEWAGFHAGQAPGLRGEAARGTCGG